MTWKLPVSKHLFYYLLQRTMNNVEHRGTNSTGCLQSLELARWRRLWKKGSHGEIKSSPSAVAVAA
jgi:hypothetical protein